MFNFSRQDVLIASFCLKETIGNPAWVTFNKIALCSVFPKSWTELNPELLLRIGFGLKCIGVEWPKVEVLRIIVLYLDRVGLIQCHLDDSGDKAKVMVRQVLANQ